MSEQIQSKKSGSRHKAVYVAVGMGIFVAAFLLLGAFHFGSALGFLHGWISISGGDAHDQPEEFAATKTRSAADDAVVNDKSAPALSGWVTDDDGTRYYDSDTHEFCQGWLQLGDERFYFDEKTGLLHIGWLELDERSYWLDDGNRTTRGALVCNTWFEEGGKTYHLSEDGPADEGWCEIDGSTYCFDSRVPS